MRTILASLLSTLAICGPVFAFDVPTTALVEIVEGIHVLETGTLNFGILARSNGAVTISAIDGSHLDPSFIVYDGSAIRQASFEVQSIENATLELVCTPGAMPGGLDLASFTVEWAESGVEDPVGDPHILSASFEIMRLGATLTVTSAGMPSPLGAVELPYTVALTFP